MFVEINGKTYVFRFRYNGTTTVAQIFVVESDGTLRKLEGEGIALLYHRDTYNEAKGRMVALADLVWKYSIPEEGAEFPEGLDRPTRILIWNEYFQSFKH